MGFVTLGFFVVYQISAGNTDFQMLALQGGMIQMISHGFISGALFLCVGVLYDRMHSRNIDDYQGVINSMPVFAGVDGAFCDGKFWFAWYLWFCWRVHGDRCKF